MRVNQRLYFLSLLLLTYLLTFSFYIVVHKMCHLIFTITPTRFWWISTLTNTYVNEKGKNTLQFNYLTFRRCGGQSINQSINQST